MQTVSHISVTLIFMGAVQGIFFALLLLSIREGRGLSNRILAALLFAASAGFISVLCIIISENQSLIRLFRLLMSMIVGCIPLLFLYVRALTVRKFKFSMKSFTHFLPVVLVVSCQMIFGAPEYDLAYALSLEALDHMSVIAVMGILYAPPYLLSIYVLMKSHSYNTAELYRKNKTISRTVIYELSVYVWVRTILIACSVYWTLSIVFFFFHDIAECYSIIPVISSAMIFILGFLGLRNPGMFYLPDTLHNEHKPGRGGGKK
ncbi:hypothetical protein ACFL60_04760 [Candidatus Omnitrophota bacterium]